METHETSPELLISLLLVRRAAEHLVLQVLLNTGIFVDIRLDLEGWTVLVQLCI